MLTAVATRELCMLPLRKYNEMLVRKPLLTKSLTSGLMYGGGDILAQVLERSISLVPAPPHSLGHSNTGTVGDSTWSKTDSVKDTENNTDKAIFADLDWRRCLIFTSYGVVCAGPMFHYWYNFLDKVPAAVDKLPILYRAAFRDQMRHRAMVGAESSSAGGGLGLSLRSLFSLCVHSLKKGLRRTGALGVRLPKGPSLQRARATAVNHSKRAGMSTSAGSSTAAKLTQRQKQAQMKQGLPMDQLSGTACHSAAEFAPAGQAQSAGLLGRGTQMLLDQTVFAATYLFMFFTGIGMTEGLVQKYSDGAVSLPFSPSTGTSVSTTAAVLREAARAEGGDVALQGQADGQKQALGAAVSDVWEHTWAHTKRVFVSTYLVDCAVWPPLQYLNFTYVPVRYQFLYINACSILYNAFLSIMANSDADALRLSLSGEASDQTAASTGTRTNSATAAVRE